MNTHAPDIVKSIAKRKFSKPRSEVIKHAAWDAAWEKAIHVHRLRKLNEAGSSHYPADEIKRDLAEAERHLSDFCNLFGSITPGRMLESTKVVAEV